MGGAVVHQELLEVVEEVVEGEVVQRNQEFALASEAAAEVEVEAH